MQEITKGNSNKGNTENNSEMEICWNDVWSSYIKTYSYPPKETLHLWNHCKDMKYQVKYSEVKNIFPSLQIKYNVQDPNSNSSRRRTTTASEVKKQTQIDKQQFDELIQRYENKYKYHPKDAKMLFNFCVEDLQLQVKYGAISRAFSSFYKPPNDRQRRHSMPAVMTRFGHFVEYDDFMSGRAEKFKTPLTDYPQENCDEEETPVNENNIHNENHNTEPGNDDHHDKQNTPDSQDSHDRPEGIQHDDKDTKTTPPISNVEQTISENIENTPNGNVENTATANEDTIKVTGTTDSVTDNGESILVEESADNKKMTEVTQALFAEIWEKYVHTFEITPQNVTQMLNFALKNGYNVTYIAIRNVWPADIPEI